MVPSSPGSAPASPLKDQKSTNPTEISTHLLLSKGGAELCYPCSPLVPGKESVTSPGMGSLSCGDGLLLALGDELQAGQEFCVGRVW